MAKRAEESYIETVEPISNSSRDWIFDLVNSIANLLAITNHATEAAYGAEQDGKLDIDGADDDKAEYVEIALMALELRRSQMNLLKEQADYFDKRMWCPLKHAIEMYMETMEVWQAEQNDTTYKHMMLAYDILLKCLSKFLGREVTLCGRCDSDREK